MGTNAEKLYNSDTARFIYIIKYSDNWEYCNINRSDTQEAYPL